MKGVEEIESWTEFLLWWESQYIAERMSHASLAEAAEIYYNQEIYMESI